MKERPVLFSGAMVRAILEGRKTQTRRVVKPQPKIVHAIHPDASITTERIFRRGDQRIRCPHGKPGDRLWVRETWACSQDYDGLKVSGILCDGDSLWWKASLPTVPEGMAACHGKWRPSIHMPRLASRITLEITGVRVETLKTITEVDAKAEGIFPNSLHGDDCFHWDNSNSGFMTAKTAYCELWNSINAKRGFEWDTDPWVWVIEFEKVS